jgi:L-threonylcarbamoyladenylate synthase
LPRTDLAKDFITGGQNNVGLRVPAQPIALALLKKFEELGGQGVAAPSANRFGAVSPTTAEAVGEELGNYLDSDDLILEGGQCLVGIESTIINCTGLAPRVLRPGAITEEMIMKVVQYKKNKIQINEETRAPGMLASHYSPKARIVIKNHANPGEGFIALSNIETPSGAIRLASPINVEEYARALYLAFRKADLYGITTVSVSPVEGDGLSLAINDRIMRASNDNFLKSSERVNRGQ